ncbi:putative secreted protein [Corynebacterium kroppenstedtii DSM 44385]|uniref:Putative secreted protein n=1 Tax=Corynebacterium kroppenstedtii (strain DSM 44385 / JCM 11950 / CIP 105744 / CCUG 35717) TaxID=645127 RepID=C4LI57_CORK4|nr:putative secreted protein [Corynebacterium kroppenstedtii DSM 44385]
MRGGMSFLRALTGGSVTTKKGSAANANHRGGRQDREKLAIISTTILTIRMKE